MDDLDWIAQSRQGDNETPVSSLRALWVGVLEAGLNDALRPFPSPRAGESKFRYTTRLRSWERDVAWVGGESFLLVCELADIDPSFALRAYEAAKARRLRKLV